MHLPTPRESSLLSVLSPDDPTEGSLTGDGAWLVCADGSRRRIGAEPLLIGRGFDCDVVVADRHLSARHALVRRSSAGLELQALGRNPTRVNGVEVVDRVALESGDHVEVPGAAFEVVVAFGRPDSAAGSWLIRHAGLLFRVSSREFVVGGSPADDLQIAWLPPGALRFHSATASLLVETAERGFRLDGRRLAPDRLEPVEPGNRIRLGDEELEITHARLESIRATSAMPILPELRAVTLRGARQGGELVLVLGDQRAGCALSPGGYALLRLLLEPSDPSLPGDPLPDAVIAKALWPGEGTRGPGDVEGLVNCLRRDLLRVGIDPTRVLDRRPERGTRFCLTPRVSVSIEPGSAGRAASH